MTNPVWVRFILAGISGFSVAACATGAPLPESVVAAKTSPQGQTTGGLLVIAHDMAAKGDHAAAIPLFRHLATTTRDPAAITGLANSLMSLGNLEAAHTLLSQHIEQDPAHASAQAYYSLGKASLALGRFEAAQDSFGAALVRQPNDSKARSGQAIALAALGNTAQAIAAFGDASDPSSLSNKALVLAASGHPDAAINILEPLLAAGSGDARERQNLAMAYLLAGREQDAFQLARLDLDAATTHETFRFYRSLASLGDAERMQALVTGVVDPEWSRQEDANLALEETGDRVAAAQRMTMPEPQPLPKSDPTPQPEPAPEPEPPLEASPADYGLSEVPPMLEPEGWALQIGAYRSIGRLMKGWSLLLERNIDILADIPPRRSEVDFGPRETGPSGFYYRLNAGPLKTLAQARDLCDELIARGTSCWIRPPEVTEGRLPTKSK